MQLCSLKLQTFVDLTIFIDVNNKKEDKLEMNTNLKQKEKYQVNDLLRCKVLPKIEQKVHLKQVTKFDVGIFNTKKWDRDQISPFPNNVKIKERILKATLIKENIKRTREKKRTFTT